MAALYATFSEGWSDPQGNETRRRSLAEDGIWLGQLVTSLLPNEPEALGPLSLMLRAEARRGARRDAAGEYVPLAEQYPGRWNLDGLSGDARLADYQPYWARAGLLARAGVAADAAQAYDRAIGLEADAAVRRFLQKRREEAVG